MKALVLSGGAYHNFAKTSKILAEQLMLYCTSIEICEDHNEFQRKNLIQYDLLVFNSLYYSGNGCIIQENAKKELKNFIDAGGSLLVIHSSLGNWDCWKEYINITGGVWDWNRSSHEPYGKMTVEVVKHHPLTTGIDPTFHIDDEKYEGLHMLDTVEVLANSISGKGKNPHMWIHRHPKARIVALALGHDEKSWGNPNFQRLLHNALSWLVNKTNSGG